MRPSSCAFSYLRCSTEQQADSGLGLEAQRASVTAAAQRLGLRLVETFVDAGSSGSLSIAGRPVLMQAVTALRRGDVLLVAKRDRLGRDVIEVAMIERLIAKRGARVVSSAGEGTDNDDPSNVLMRRLIDCFSEYERLLISSRTRAALSAKRQRGERVSGKAPYGYQHTDDGRRLEPHDGEQVTLDRIRASHAAGQSLRRIAAVLNEDGVCTRAGGPWRFEYVRNVLKAAPSSHLS